MSGDAPTPGTPPARLGKGLRQRAFRRLRRGVRGRLLGALSRFGPSGDDAPPELQPGTRVLLVQASFRLGHNLLATAGVDAVAAAVGHEVVGLLAGPPAPELAAGFGLHRVHVVHRFDVIRPLRFLALLRAVRRERYQVAIHLGGSGVSLGALLTGLSGAPRRIGRLASRGNLFFTTALPQSGNTHKLDEMAELVEACGVEPARQPRVPLGETERREARGVLRRELGTGTPVGFFLSGRARKGKAWELKSLAGVARRLQSRGCPVVVFLGPEERALRERIRSHFGPALYLETPDLRRLAALCSACAAVVAPDSGPMHLAVAAGTPTVALFRKDNQHRWGPRPPHAIVMDPAGVEMEGILAALEELLPEHDATSAGRDTPVDRAG